MVAIATAVSTKPNGDVTGWSPTPAMLIVLGVVLVLAIAARAFLTRR